MKPHKRTTKWYHLTNITIRRRILVGMILLLALLLLLFAYITRDPRILWCPGPGMALAAVYKYYFHENHPSHK